MYTNIVLDSADRGRTQFIKYGAGCTFGHVPRKCPDTRAGHGWKYKRVGFVDLAKGVVVERESQVAASAKPNWLGVFVKEVLCKIKPGRDSGKIKPKPPQAL